jgi:hypothetical protein
MNRNIILCKIIDDELDKRFLNLDLNENKYIKCIGKSRVDGKTFILIDNSTIRRIKLDEVFSDMSIINISDVENEIIKAIENKDKDKVEFLII